MGVSWLYIKKSNVPQVLLRKHYLFFCSSASCNILLPHISFSCVCVCNFLSSSFLPLAVASHVMYSPDDLSLPCVLSFPLSEYCFLASLPLSIIWAKVNSVFFLSFFHMCLPTPGGLMCKLVSGLQATSIFVSAISITAIVSYAVEWETISRERKQKQWARERASEVRKKATGRAS